jgi:ADP-heptose:LPS heptosyltransferase
MKLLSADMMRKIDRWVGVPCCFVATLVACLMRIARARPDPGPPKRILFIEMAEIGGLVVAYPAMNHACKRYPDAELYFLTFSGGEGILDLLGLVPPERRIIIRPDNPMTFLADALGAVRRIRAEKIDTTINLETFARFSTLLAFLGGAARRVGFHRFFDEGRYIGGLVTHKVIYNPHIHAAETFISLVEAAGEQAGGEPLWKMPTGEVSMELPRAESFEEARRAVTEKLRALYPPLEPHHRVVLINPNASDLVAVRRWPVEHFIELARGLLEAPEVVLVLTGTSDERPHAETIIRAVGSDRLVNMAGLTTLRQLIDLYNVSHLLVTNDSGPAHFASLTDMPGLVLYGPETPGIYGPLGPNMRVIYRSLACSPCVSAYNQKRSPCNDNICMSGITPEEVLSQARAMLSERPTPVRHGD